MELGHYKPWATLFWLALCQVIDPIITWHIIDICFPPFFKLVFPSNYYLTQVTTNKKKLKRKILRPCILTGAPSVANLRERISHGISTPSSFHVHASSMCHMLHALITFLSCKFWDILGIRHVKFVTPCILGLCLTLILWKNHVDPKLNGLGHFIARFTIGCISNLRILQFIQLVIIS